MNKLDYAYGRSVEMIRELSTEHGFIASKTDKDNYKRVFSRDGVILGLASLSIGEKDLIECFKQTLITLKEFQGEEGEIPSNVEVNGKKVSYGGTTGRVDATLWFIIGVSQYVKKTKDLMFLKEMFNSVKRCINLLDSWEFNEKNFIYVPQGGDWADEYINEGYVLYDEVLYYKVLEEYSYMLKKLNKDDREVLKKAKTIKEMIKVNFWPKEENSDSKYIYHKGLYERVLSRKESRFFIAAFSPGGYRNNFDSFGNALSIILNIVDKDKQKSITKFIKEKFGKNTHWVIPAFSPVVTEKDSDWTALKTNYSYRFKNYPNQYHNGGLWPLTTGFISIALNHAGEKNLSEKYLEGIADAIEKNDWGFHEFLDGKTFEPKGTRLLGFSASSYVLAYNVVKNNIKIIH